ncbi:MAG TPA: hypothetical protein VFQ68_37980 [Streptosporangiaceae bacterium]|nr:hypothetical protein [Streptosporangiaceae bacterium]
MDIWAKTWAGQESGARLGDGEAGGEAGLAAERAVAIAVAPGVPAGPAAGWPLPGAELHPAQARATVSRQPRNVPATRCLTTTLISPGCFADPAQYH